MKGKITLLFERNGVNIDIKDELSNTTFFSGKIEPEDVLAMMSRQAYVPIEFDAVGLDKIGKKMEMDTLEFELDKEGWYNKNYAKQLSVANCPEGWVPDTHFSSQDSFFMRDGKRMARCTIRRWVDVG